MRLRTCIGMAGAALSAVILPGCGGTFSGPPTVTAAMVGSARRQHLDDKTLVAGRAVFVSRCIECHVLPSIAEHSAAAWPAIIGRMSTRADLTRTEREALVAYILAAKNP
ncbi:MAG: cytochrome c [Chthoniobacterales bacterium]